MRAYGVNFGNLTDEEYMHFMDVDDFVGRPLQKAANEIHDAQVYTQSVTLDNQGQRNYLIGEVESMICGLKEILDNLEGKC